MTTVPPQDYQSGIGVALHLARALRVLATADRRTLRTRSDASTRRTACASRSTFSTSGAIWDSIFCSETYNLSGGYTFPAWELHLTAFAPDFIRHMGSDEKGFAAYYERRFLNDTLAAALQARLADAPGVARFIWGGLAKYYFEPLRTLVMAGDRHRAPGVRGGGRRFAHADGRARPAWRCCRIAGS